MLLEFGAKNFYNFKEGFEISLKLQQACPEKFSHNKEYATILGLKGANASGKTNALKALSFLADFCCNSFNLKPDESIQIESFFRNSEPVEFFIVFKEKKIEYRYELSLTNKEVISEVLYRKEKKQISIIDRNTDSFKYIHPDYKDLGGIKLRKNASLISTAFQYEVKVIKIFYVFFHNFLSNISSDGMNTWISNSLEKISEYYFRNPGVFDFVKNILIKSDLGINEIKIEEKTNEIGIKKYYPNFGHKVGNKIYYLPYVNQSSGTKALYKQLWSYETILRIGGILVLDEFDIYLHPDILPTLIKLFDDKKTNSKNAQLIFTTHNSDIMDKLSKYRTVLIRKEENESYLYRLDEIPGDILRNDREISPIYKSGKIGGVPRL